MNITSRLKGALALLAMQAAAGGAALSANEIYPFENRALSAEERTADLVGRMTLDEKINTLTSGFNYHGCPRLGVPDFQTADGPLGVASWGLRGRATAFPASIALAASWNRDLAREVGKAYADEWRVRGLDVLYGPGVNLSRSAKDSRNFEYFGEDPYLTAEIAVPFTQAVQQGGVLAVVKHFAGNDQEFDRYLVNSEVDERTLRELYFYPFEDVVTRGGALAVMTGYNPLNGTYCAQNPWLLRDVLRDEWGFRGTVMSDWGATHACRESIDGGLDMELGTVDFLVADKVKPLIESGAVKEEAIDAMVANIYRPLFELGIFDRKAAADTTLSLYSSSRDKIARRAAAEGIVMLKNEGGLLPLSKNVRRIAVIGPNAAPTGPEHGVFGGGGSSKVVPWHLVSDLAGIVAEFPDAEVTYAEGVSNHYLQSLFDRTGVVNFKENTVYFDPIDLADTTWMNAAPQVWKTTITPDRDDDVNLFVQAQGGWRISVDGATVADRLTAKSISNGHATVPGKKGVPMEVTVEYRDNRANPREMRFGWDYASSLTNGFSEALRQARRADVVIFAGGFDSFMEYEGTDRTFELPFGQAELIAALAEVNPNMVVTLRGGGGMATEQWIDRVPALLWLSYPGQEGGTALASVISGEVNPSGKLPFTMERKWEDSPVAGCYDNDRANRNVRYDEGIFMGYRGFDRNGTEPLFPFGHGLSYSDFTYSNLKVTPVDGEPATFTVSVDVTNNSGREGAEVVQLYVGDTQSSLPRPVRELKGFEKVNLAPGATATVTMRLTPRSFRFFNPSRSEWVIEPGEFVISAGASSRDIRLSEPVKIGKRMRFPLKKH